MSPTTLSPTLSPNEGAENRKAYAEPQQPGPHIQHPSEKADQREGFVAFVPGLKPHRDAVAVGGLNLGLGLDLSGGRSRCVRRALLELQGGVVPACDLQQRDAQGSKRPHPRHDEKQDRPVSRAFPHS